MARSFITTSFPVTILVAAIFVAPRPLAPIFGEKLAAGFVGGTIVTWRIVIKTIAVFRRARVCLDLILARLIFPRLIFAYGGQVVGYGFFFVEPDLAGVGAHKTFVEDASGELVEVLLFEGAQHASADFGGIGDGLEPDALLLALLAKFFSECTQGRLRQTDSISIRIEME
jgi:hypothetical protein